MKLLKSFASMRRKRKGGMSKDEESASYEQYDGVYPNPTGTHGEKITLEGRGSKEDYYCWVFYEEDVDDPDKPGKKKNRFHFVTEEEQERYEWFCAGWVQFYDTIVRPKAPPTSLIKQEHKLFFFWDRANMPGVAIYTDDVSVIAGASKDIILTYTPATATGDPPTTPPPPPPSKT